MREPNLNDPRLTLRNLKAKRRLYELAKKLKVPMDRVFEQLVLDAPVDLKITQSSSDSEEPKKHRGKLKQAQEKAQEKADAAKKRIREKIASKRKPEL